MREPQIAVTRGVKWIALDGLLFSVLLVWILWLRFGNTYGADYSAAWPSPSVTHLQSSVGAGMIALLIASSWMVHRAVLNAADRACGARWLGRVFGCGLVFVALQASEMRARWRDNLVPTWDGSGVHNRADLYYLAAVGQRLRTLNNAMNLATIRSNTSPQQASDEALHTERGDLLKEILESSLRWTETQVATGERVEDQRNAIISLAQDVHATQDYAKVQDEFYTQIEREDGERLRIASQERERSQAIVAAKSGPMNAAFKQVEALKLQVETLRHQLERSRSGEDADESKSENSDQPTDQAAAEPYPLEALNADLEKQLEAAMNQRTELAQQVTEAEESIVRANDVTQEILARQTYRQKLPAEGLNARYRWLKLPVAMPSGRNWAIAYFALSLIHLMHTVIALLQMLPRLMRCELSLDLLGVSRLWHLHTAVGVVMLAFLYLF